MVHHHSHFIEEKRVGLAELMRGAEIFLGKSHVVECKVLHAEEELGEMGALEETGGCAVCGYSLVVLAFCSESMCKTYPSGAEVRIHHRSFGEKPSSFGNGVDGKVIHTDRKPSAGLIWVEVREAM